MNARQIRAWLLQQPRATTIRVTDLEGAQHTIDPQGLSLARVGESIHALGPELIEAIGPKGALLRACRPSNVDDDDVDDVPTSSSSSSTRSKPAAAAAMPNVADLEPFARMLADAYRHSTSLAFDKLVELYNASNERLLALERMQQRELERREKELELREEELAEQQAEQAATGSGDIVTEMVGAFMGGAKDSSAETASKSNGKANGKA